MRFVLVSITLWFASLGAVPHPVVFAAGTSNPARDALDAPITKAGSLRDLLSNEILLREYRNAVQNYFGKSRISDAQFDAVMEQVRALISTTPGLDSRLMEPLERYDSLSLTLNAQSAETPRKRPSLTKINEEVWNAQLDTWNAILHKQAKHRLQMRPEQILEELRAIETEITIFERRLSRHISESPGGARKNLIRETRAGFYSKLRNSERVTSITAAIVLERLQTGTETAAALASADPEIILRTVEDLQTPRFWIKSVNDIAAKNGINAQGLERVASFIADRAHTIRTVESDVRMFPELLDTTSKGTTQKYEMIPFLRRIHAIWSHAWINECIAGSERHLMSTTPRRWAVAAIENSAHFAFERNGHFSGAVRVFPIKNSGQLYGSLEVSVPVLRKPVIVGKEKRALMDFWLEEFVHKSKSQWQRLVVSESTQSDNARVFRTIRGTPQFALGLPIATADDFVPQQDIVIEEIEEKSKDIEYILNPGRIGALGTVPSYGMVYDWALAPRKPNSLDYGLLTALSDVPRNTLDSHDTIAKFLATAMKAKDQELQRRIVQFLSEKPIYDPRIVEQLTLMLPTVESTADYSSSLIREKIAKLLFQFSAQYHGARIVIADAIRAGHLAIIEEIAVGLGTEKYRENAEILADYLLQDSTVVAILKANPSPKGSSEILGRYCGAALSGEPTKSTTPPPEM